MVGMTRETSNFSKAKNIEYNAKRYTIASKIIQINAVKLGKSNFINGIKKTTNMLKNPT